MASADHSDRGSNGSHDASDDYEEDGSRYGLRNGHNGHHRGRYELPLQAPRALDPAPDDEKRLDLAQLVGALRAGKRVVAVLTLLVLTIVMAITMASRMEFTIRGSIYMGDLKSKGGMLNMVASQFDFGVDKGNITTEIQILKSRKLWTQAMLASGLNTNLTPVDWSPPRYLSWRLKNRDVRSLAGAWPELRPAYTKIIDDTGNGQKREVQIKVTAANDYDVLSEGHIIGHGSLGKPLVVPGLELTLLAGPEGPTPGRAYDLTVYSIDDVLQDLERRVSITAPKGQVMGSEADIVYIALTSKAPYQARVFIDELMHAYLDQSLAWKTEEAATAEKFLTSQLENVRASLDKAGRELAEFKKKSSTVDLGEEAKAMITQIGTLEQQRVAARLAVESLQQVKAILAKGNVPTEAYLMGEAQDTVLVSMGQALVQAQTEYKALAQQFTPDYPPLKEAKAALEAQLETVQSYVDTRLKRAREQVASLDAVMEKYNGELKQLPDTEFKLVTLTQENEVYGKLYEFLLERQQQAALTKASTISQNRVLDAPTLPSLEATPKLKSRALLGLVLGLFLGIAVVLLRWRLSTTYQSETELRSELPNLPVFASVPKLKSSHGQHEGATHPMEVLAADPRSPIAEAFRLLRTNLYYSGSRDRDKVLVVTSPGPSDGKTSATMCLAWVLSADGKRVLVVDADMRKPSHHILLRQPQQPGLSDILTGVTHWSDAVHAVHVQQHDISSISTGIAPPSPAELLSSRHLAAFLSEAREKYDFILIDSPPFPLVSDALVLSHSADRVLSMIRIGTTHRRATEDHTHRISAVTPHYGIVINGIGESQAYGYGYGYGYGQGPSVRSKRWPWRGRKPKVSETSERA